MQRGQRCAITGLCDLTAALLMSGPALVCRAAPAPQQASSAPMQSLQPVVRRFDFEEPDAPPNALPADFVRNIAPSQGFPNFGGMRLTTGTACQGNGAFEFELGGGSMSASVPIPVMPILPLADYAIRAKVRTQGLTNARARLVAWLHDKAGRPIDQSRQESSLVETAGEWQTIGVEIHGEHADAADLVIELQLLQPDQIEPPGGQPELPRPQDISGFAWFDEVIVSRMSRLDLTMNQPLNIVRKPDAADLLIHVEELTNGALFARLRVFNIDGQTVFDTTFPAPRGRQGTPVRVPIDACGWYRAILDLGEPLRQEHLDFLVVSADPIRASSRSGLGVALSGVGGHVAEVVPELVRSVGVNEVVVPIWSDSDAVAHPAVLHAMIDQLLRANANLTLKLEAVPASIVRASQLDKPTVIDVLMQDPGLWRPTLDDLLISFGLEVQQWQIGGPTAAVSAQRASRTAAADALRASLAGFVPDPRILAACPVEQAPGDLGRVSPVLTVPHHVQPPAIAEYAEAWTDRESDLMVHFESLPEGTYAPRQRVVDMAHRALYGWRARVPVMLIDAPWTMTSGRNPRPMPDPLFGPWRTLAAELSGREFAGELHLGADSGVRCWILRGRSGDAALVAWSDSGSASGGQVVSSQLAHGRIEITDLFGNRSIIEPVNGLHSLAISDAPVFITGANIELVQFRGSIQIEPAFVPAVSKMHEHTIVLRNPWGVAATGSIRLTHDEQWQIVPAVHEFTIPSHGEARLPLGIIPHRSIVAGPKRIEADINVHADRTYGMRFAAELEVGLQNIELSVSSSHAQNARSAEPDLIITAAVTNTGPQRVNLDLFILAPELGQNRRTIAGLGPGETTVRTFRIAGGARTLAGKQVRVGVADRDGPTRLNHVLTVAGDPALTATAGDRQ